MGVPKIRGTFKGIIGDIQGYIGLISGLGIRV